MVVPLPPAEIVAPPVKLTVTVPLVTVSRVVEMFELESVTDTPVMVRLASSLTVWEPATVFTGATFPSVMVIVPNAPPLLVILPPLNVPVVSVKVSLPSLVASVVVAIRIFTEVVPWGIVIPDVAENHVVSLNEYSRVLAAAVSVPIVAVPLAIVGVNVVAAFAALLRETVKTPVEPSLTLGLLTVTTGKVAWVERNEFKSAR